MKLIPPRSAWTTGLGTTLAFGNWGALPFIVGALVEGAGFAPDKAAFLGSTELTLMGLTMLALAPVVPRINRVLMVGLALPAVILAQVASAFVSDYVALLGIRSISGIAFAVLFSVGTAEGADAAEPERAFAGATVIAMIFGMFKSPMLGYSKDLFGYRGVFLFLACYYLLVGLLFLLLLKKKSDSTRSSAIGRSAAPVMLFAVMGVLFVMGMFSVATGGVFAFVERVANSVGISARVLGSGFAVAALIGTLGGKMAERLGLRWGRILPTFGGMALLGVFSWLVMAAGGQPEFWGAYIIWVIVHWFAYSYIMGLSVLVDPLGRIATVTAATYILTGAAGTALAGVVTNHSGLASYGGVAFCTCMLGGIVAMLLIRVWRPDASSPIAPPAA